MCSIAELNKNYFTVKKTDIRVISSIGSLNNIIKNNNNK